jgi:hypothetical protein
VKQVFYAFLKYHMLGFGTPKYFLVLRDNALP